MTLEPVFDKEALAGISDSDLEALYQSIIDGAKSPAESLGIDTDSMGYFESVALGYYGARKFDTAAVIFGFMLKLDTHCATAWRGLGGCAQSLGNHPLATNCFALAFTEDPTDIATRVLWGESLCLAGEVEDGKQCLEDAIAAGTEEADLKPYLARARAILGAEGGVPAKVVFEKNDAPVQATTNEQIFPEAPELAAQLFSGIDYDEDRDVTLEDLQKNPELLDQMRDLMSMMGEGRITPADVGGFTDNELDGAYAVAAKYADQGEYMQAILLCGTMVLLNVHEARAYQLMAICMQHMKFHDGADQFYRMATAIDPADPKNVIYRGEGKIVTGQVDEGLELVRAGLALAEKDPAAHGEDIARANMIISEHSP